MESWLTLQPPGWGKSPCLYLPYFDHKLLKIEGGSQLPPLVVGLTQCLTQTAFWVPLWDPRDPNFWEILGPRNDVNNVILKTLYQVTTLVAILTQLHSQILTAPYT